jgi:sorbose reductase
MSLKHLRFGMDPTTNASLEVAARGDLTKRTLPKMILSDGSSTSLTTAPIEKQQGDTQHAAEQRFAVKGSAIVTGGSGTLGMVASRALLQHGLTGLTLFDLGISKSDHQINRLKEEFPSAKIEVPEVDVRDEVVVAKAVEETVRLHGSVDILLCFAGVVGCVHALEMTVTQWRQILDINTTGSFICAQACARQMVRQGNGGSIIFAASISAHRVNYPQPQAAYNVSKAALLTLKNSLAAEWARYGIRTNSISPGYMDTILNEGEGLADARRIWAERNPSGRMGTPSELTGAIVLLASSAGTYINGADIVVDGGAVVF